MKLEFIKPNNNYAFTPRNQGSDDNIDSGLYLLSAVSSGQRACKRLVIVH